MAHLPFILICVAAIVLGAAGGKPLGWIALGLSVLALLLDLGVGR